MEIELCLKRNVIPSPFPLFFLLCVECMRIHTKQDLLVSWKGILCIKECRNELGVTHDSWARICAVYLCCREHLRTVRNLSLLCFSWFKVAMLEYVIKLLMIFGRCFYMYYHSFRDIRLWIFDIWYYICNCVPTWIQCKYMYLNIILLLPFFSRIVFFRYRLFIVKLLCTHRSLD